MEVGEEGEWKKGRGNRKSKDEKINKEGRIHRGERVERCSKWMNGRK